mgnify:CR=1 FL=1
MDKTLPYVYNYNCGERRIHDAQYVCDRNLSEEV